MQNCNRPFRHRHQGGKILLAFILIAVGIILLGVNTGWISQEYRPVLISWPMLLVVIGMSKLFKRNYWGGSIIFMVGAFFLIPLINKAEPAFFSFIPNDFVKLYWPVLLIALGAFIFLRRLFPNAEWLSCQKRFGKENLHQHEAYTDKGRIEIENVFGGSEQIVLDPEFKGGEITSVFGGAKLDLRKTSLPEGITVLEVNVVFGGVEVYVPLGWNIELKIDSILGGFNDKRTGLEVVDASRKLLIKGSCVFGGGELKN